MRIKRVLDAAALVEQIDQPGPGFEVIEVACILRTCPSSIHSLMKKGELRAKRLPGLAKILIERSAVREYLDRAERAAAEAATVEAPAATHVPAPVPTHRRRKVATA